MVSPLKLPYTIVQWQICQAMWILSRCPLLCQTKVDTFLAVQFMLGWLQVAAAADVCDYGLLLLKSTMRFLLFLVPLISIGLFQVWTIGWILWNFTMVPELKRFKFMFLSQWFERLMWKYHLLKILGSQRPKSRNHVRPQKERSDTDEGTNSFKKK